MGRSLYDVIRGIIGEELRRVRTAEIGIVSEVRSGSSECCGCMVQLRSSSTVLGPVPVATSKIGTVALPAVGDVVLVQFIDGDVNSPVIVGSLYNDSDPPPEADENRVLTHLPRNGKEDESVHFELCNDTDQSIVLRVGKAAVVTLSSKDPAVSIDVNDGNAKITVAGDGTVCLEANSDVKIQSTANVSIKGDAGVSIESSGNVVIKGAQVQLN